MKPPVTLEPDDLRAYANRDWNAPLRLARRARARLPIADKVRIAIELYEAARRTDPNWPDDATRRRDLDNHIRLRTLLRKARHVGAR